MPDFKELHWKEYDEKYICHSIAGKQNESNSLHPVQ
jgi:hypothetical protein